MDTSPPLLALRLHLLQMRRLNQQVQAHSAWLDRLSDHYNRPRVELIALLDAPGALEYEAARLMSKAALDVARDLIRERERPDEDKTDPWDRAVYGHWRQ